MTTQRVSAYSSKILGATALATAIESCDAEAGTDISKFIHPVTAVAGITVKLQHGRATTDDDGGRKGRCDDARKGRSA
jgi:hypothetical protein